MAIVRRWGRHVAGAVCALSLAGAAHADVLLDTGTPGGFFGYYGFDVFVGQSVAIAFTPTQDYSFDSASLWLMSNDFEAAGRTLLVSLQADAGSGAVPAGPSGTALESWSHATTAVGWTPVLETLNSVTHPLLSAGTTYWIVAESSEPAFVDPVWVAAGNGPMYYMGNISFANSPAWQIGQTGGPPGAMVSATPVPEPAAWALGLLGVPLMLGAVRRRSTRRTVR
jgi:hypothetical protein